MSRGATAFSSASHAGSSAAAQRAHRDRARRHRRAAGLIRLAILLLVLAAAIWTSARVAHATADASAFNGVIHFVQPGETLWGIVTAEYDAGRRDVRELIYYVERRNQLHSADLHPGQRLILPYVE